MKKIYILALAAALNLPAHAQVVVQAASSQLQPQIGRDAKGYTSCGIRALVMDMKPDVVEAYDFTLSMSHKMMAGSMKAGKSSSPIAKFNKGEFDPQVVMPGPVNFWIAKESEGKALTPVKTIAAKTPGYILGLTEFAGTWAIVMEIVSGQRVQFATRYENQPYDTVVSFAGALKEEEFKPLAACFEGLMMRMKEEVQQKLNK